jgi:hypothetical protein
MIKSSVTLCNLGAGSTFLAQQTGFDETFISSEIVRYLGGSTQASGYKIGRRAWLDGRDRAGRDNPGILLGIRRLWMAESTGRCG